MSSDLTFVICDPPEFIHCSSFLPPSSTCKVVYTTTASYSWLLCIPLVPALVSMFKVVTRKLLININGDVSPPCLTHFTNFTQYLNSNIIPQGYRPNMICPLPTCLTRTRVPLPLYFYGPITLFSFSFSKMVQLVPAAGPWHILSCLERMLFFLISIYLILFHLSSLQCTSVLFWYSNLGERLTGIA